MRASGTLRTDSRQGQVQPQQLAKQRQERLNLLHQEQQEAQRSALGDLSAVFEDTVWAEVYAACCCDAREAPTLEAARAFRDALLAQNPETRPDRLSLRGLRLGATTISCLGLQLKDRGYTRLDLSDNQLGDHAALSVRSLVRALPRLRQLYLAGNVLGNEGAQELAEELEANSTLELLALGGMADAGAGGRGFRPNAIGSEGLKTLLGALARNPQPALTSLNLCQTALGVEAGRRLAAFLEHDQTLLHLDVSCNPLGSEGVCALLPQCTRLRLLDISDTECRGEFIHSPLAALLQKTTALSRLSVARNPLETRPLRRISRGVASCQSLTSLDLEATSMGTEGVTVLVEALLGSTVQSLTEINLSSNQLSQVEAATALAQAISKYATLAVLRLSQNALGDAGAMELAGALDPATCPDSGLQHLELGTCRVGSAGAAHFLSRLAQNESLRVLRLGDNFIDDTLDMTLVDKLEHLHELQLTGNRLSHAALNRAAQACARNRQRARDEEPSALRSEMHRLLFQETKLGLARQQVQKDEAEVSARQAATEKTLNDLHQFRAAEHDAQRQLAYKIDLEEVELEQARERLKETGKQLEEAARRYSKQQRDLRDRLHEREQVLLDLQVQADHGERLLEQRKAEHPLEVQRIHARVLAAAEEMNELQEQARHMRAKLRQLQNKSLIDCKP